MTFPISAGVYAREIDQSFVVPASATGIGAIVLSCDKGPTDAPVLISNQKDLLDRFGQPKTDEPSKYAALAFLEKGNALYAVRAINDAVVATYELNDDQGVPVKVLDISAINAGAWGNDITVTVGAADTATTVFTITVKYNAVEVESFAVSLDATKKDGFGRSQYVEDAINGKSAYITVTHNVANTSATGAVGSSVFVITDQALDTTAGSDDTVAPTDVQVNAAYDMYLIKEQYDINFLIGAGFTTASIQGNMIVICEARKDCIALLDVPSTDVSSADHVTHAGTTLNADTSWAALYSGWIRIKDQYTDREVLVPPSGYVAGAFAFTAQNSEVWYAPAGSRRGVINGAQGVNIIYSEADRDLLQQNRVNPIQNFVGEGIQIYGQKTLQVNASALDRVNVRMLMITIEKEISKALRPFVFEFNDEFTRENVSSIINNYMEDIETRRGVTEFLVVANETNNTPTVIDQNKMIVDVYVKPTRVAEFIQLNTIISATGAKFTVSE